MKIILFVIILLTLNFLSAFAQLSDATGLVKRFNIETGGYQFQVKTISNYDITDIEFSKDDKRLTLFLSSNVKNNLGEIEIPKNLINGNFTFFLNDKQIFSHVRYNEQISFITVEFPDSGFHKLDIIGTTYLPEFSDVAPLVLATSLIGIILFKKFRN